MKKIKNVNGIKDPYTRRILSYIINKDAFKIYSKTPAALRKLTRGLSEKQLRRVPTKGRWPVAFLISHFCDAELVMSFRLRMAIAQSGRRIQAYDQDLWAKHLSYKASRCKDKLALFEALRTSNIALLKLLTPAQWKKYGIHEERGKETVERMVQMLAGHDINHLRQVKEIRNSLLRKTKQIMVNS